MTYHVGPRAWNAQAAAGSFGIPVLWGPIASAVGPLWYVHNPIVSAGTLSSRAGLVLRGMKAQLPAPLGDDHLHMSFVDIQLNLRSTFTAPLVLCIALLLTGLATSVTYTANPGDDHVNQYYMWYVHVSIMIFVGFGLLMTFLRRYSYSAIAINYFASALAVLEFMLVGGFVQQLWTKDDGFLPVKIELDLPLMIDALFCAGSCMIMFGAVLGKTTPSQIMWLVLLQVPVYAINQKLVFEYLKGLDIGGGLTIHAFGAYYGLAASMLLSKQTWGLSHPKNGSAYLNDITSMIGTLFLFIYWPSFNGALASNPEMQELSVQTQFYCVVNTVFGLLGAVLATFATSLVLEGKFNMMHIQNATLAGGVAVGCSADLRIQPAGALAIGLLAGALSTVGFARVQPFLERRIGLRDTCGVHNLHGMPGVLGGLCAAVASAVSYGANDVLLDTHHHGTNSGKYQLACIACTVGMALVSGLLAGAFVKYTTPKKLEVTEAFEDEPYWEGVTSEQLPEQGDSFPGRSSDSSEKSGPVKV